ncbi:MAG TPA: helix-turn-helix domain-containing protein [Candidatus Saccharimonadales bacterium]|nr:helix-turn-helix domain-containing protein [Candidatus Saccharimonadales bacterium]
MSNAFEEVSTGHPSCIRAAASIIGAKWTPQLLYAMCQGTTRFCEMQKAVGGINPRTLSARLDELESAGIVCKTTFNEMPPRVEYCLTDKGADLVPILEHMATWSEKYPPHKA